MTVIIEANRRSFASRASPRFLSSSESASASQLPTAWYMHSAWYVMLRPFCRVSKSPVVALTLSSFSLKRFRPMRNFSIGTVPDVPMRPTTIRFAPDAMELINDAAQDLGISVAQFVREAAIMRAMLEGRTRDDLMALAIEVSRLSRRSD